MMHFTQSSLAVQAQRHLREPLQRAAVFRILSAHDAQHCLA